MKSDNNEPSKSTSWKVLETVLSHFKVFFLILWVAFLAFYKKWHNIGIAMSMDWKLQVCLA